MKAFDFEYAGKNLSDFGFIICNFGDKGLDTVSNGAVVSFDSVPVQNGTKYELTSSTYEDCLETTIQICKNICDNGTMETQRYDEAKIIFASSGDEFIPGDPVPEIEVHEPEYSELGMPADVQCTEEQMRLGHNGIDFWLLVYFIKYLNGEHEPFFNVYRATALSAAAIMGWKSILNQSKEYIIPDFSNEEERKAYENDFLSPFEDEDSPNFISRKTNR
jgi:hypothetical protein